MLNMYSFEEQIRKNNFIESLVNAGKNNTKMCFGDACKLSKEIPCEYGYPVTGKFNELSLMIILEAAHGGDYYRVISKLDTEYRRLVKQEKIEDWA